MKLVTKTVLKEHIGPFLAGIGTIVFVFLLNIVFRDLGRLLGRGLPFIIIFKFFYLNMAWIIALAVPMSVLLASLMAFGRLSADNEITALKASGVHFYTLLSPVLMAAGILALIMIPFDNNVLPEFNHQWRNLYSDVSQTRPTLTLEPDVFFNDIPQFSILVRRVKEKGSLLEDIIVNDMRDPRFNKTIMAKRGKFNFLKDEGRMVMTLFDGEIHDIEKSNLENYRRMRFKKHTFSIMVSDAVLRHSAEAPRGDREKTAGMMRNDIREYRDALSRNEENIRSSVFLDLSGIFPKMDDFQKTSIFEESCFYNTFGIHLHDLNRLIQHEHGLIFSKHLLDAHPWLIRRPLKSGIIADSPDGFRVERMRQRIWGEANAMRISREAIASRWVEIHKKFSIPVACLVFVIVGAPLGVQIRQSGLAMAGLMSIVFYMIFWSFLIGGEELADRMILNPALAMWAPNVIVGLAGILLMVQTGREESFLYWIKRLKTRIKGIKKI
jgi:lipopolysaccharide export system permease protein